MTRAVIHGGVRLAPFPTLVKIYTINYAQSHANAHKILAYLIDKIELIFKNKYAQC